MRSLLPGCASRRTIPALLALLSLAFAPPVRAQGAPLAGTPAAQNAPRTAPASAFTIDDALDMVSYTVADVTKDGRWIAATSSTRRDGLGTDYFRDTDPTYVREPKVRALVVDVSTGAERAIFPDKRTVRNLQWSPDGARLAMFAFRGEVFEPTIWDRASGKLTTVKIPSGQYVAENSELRWTPDGAGLVFSLRSTSWREKAKAQFARYTKGPVFVQSGSDPFLAWDEIRRLSAIRSIALYDTKTQKVTELVAERRVSGYTLAEDASTLTFTEDLVEKTQYEAGQGAGNKVWLKRLPAGVPAVLYATTRGINLVWAPDGKRYAYTREGRVFLASVDDTAGKQIAGPTGPARQGGQADTSSAARDSAGRARFTASRFSPKGDLLIVSNRDGQWILDLATGSRELMFPTPDSTDLEAPRTTVIAWSEDGNTVYLGTASRTKWERGDRSATTARRSRLASW